MKIVDDDDDDGDDDDDDDDDAYIKSNIRIYTYKNKYT